MKDLIPLSQLENHVLARIDHDGPITAYRVRRQFEASPTEALCSSSGSIYPVVHRLEHRGLLKSAATDDDARGTRHLESTDAGTRQVRAWLRSSDGADHLAEDPLRTKALFLDRLKAGEQKAWLRQALGEGRRKLGEIEDFAQHHGESRTEYWAHQNALLSMRARIEWLEAWLASKQRTSKDRERHKESANEANG